MRFVIYIFITTFTMLNASVIEGSGNKAVIQKEFKDIAKFNIQTPIDTLIEKADRNYYILSGDDNIVGEIDIKEDEDELTVSASKNFSTKIGLNLHIYAKEIESLLVNGSMDIRLKNLNEEILEIRAEGAIGISSVENSYVKNISIFTNGAVDIDFEKLISQTSMLRLIGVGDVVINSYEKPKVEVQGVYNIQNKGAMK